MPLFFFDTRADSEARDEEGTECSTIAKAEAEALRRVSVFASDPANLTRIGTIASSVRDQNDTVIATAWLVYHLERSAT